MADKIVKITFEIDGLQQSVTNIDDAKVALQKLESQAKETGDAAETAAKDFDKLGDASKDAGEAGEGAISVLDEATGGLASRFRNVIGGIGKMGKALKNSFKSGIAGANSLRTALISTGIGALVIALGTIVAYWDDIAGLVSGVTDEQKKLNEEVDANVTAQEDALEAITAQENSLRLQGKSEDEIRKLKIAQTDEVINATLLQLEQMEATKKAQVAAAQRNKDIAQGVIRFMSLPITILLSTVDTLTKVLSKIPGIDIATDLEESFSGGIAGMIFDPEEVEEEGNAAIEETKSSLVKLQNTRAGFIIQGQKADEAARKKKTDADNKKTAEDDAKKLADQKELDAGIAAAIKLSEDAQKVRDAEAIENANIKKEMLQQADLDLIDSTYLRAQEELRIQREADIKRIEDAGATDKEILRIKESFDKKKRKLEEENLEFEKALRDENIDNALSAGSQILGSIVDLVEEGSGIAKSAAIAQTTIDTYQSANAAYKSVVGIPVVGPVLAPIAAGVAIASGLASINKIMSTKVPGGGGGTGGGGISVPAAPTFNPTDALNAGAEDLSVDNQLTLGEQEGSAGATVVKAFVVSSDMTQQQEADKKIKDLARL